jgi:hypothetical protein
LITGETNFDASVQKILKESTRLRFSSHKHISSGGGRDVQPPLSQRGVNEKISKNIFEESHGDSSES